MNPEERNRNEAYDATVSTSREESMLRAVDLLIKELENTPKPRVPRPEIDWKRTIAVFLLWLAPILAAWLLVPSAQPYSGWIRAAAAVLMTCVMAKPLLRHAIMLYQRFAPQRIRSACVFEPTCSNYMLQAVEKYGFIRGVWKGIRRLLRCRYPNFGTDEP